MLQKAPLQEVTGTDFVPIGAAMISGFVHRPHLRQYYFSLRPLRCRGNWSMSHGCFSFFDARNWAIIASFSHIYAPRLVSP